MICWLAKLVKIQIAHCSGGHGSSKILPAAPILAQLAEMSDNICSVSGHDSNLLASQASKILTLASNESKTYLSL